MTEKRPSGGGLLIYRQIPPDNGAGLALRQSGSHSFAMAMQEEVVVLEWPIERKRVLLSISE